MERLLPFFSSALSLLAGSISGVVMDPVGASIGGSKAIVLRCRVLQIDNLR